MPKTKGQKKAIIDNLSDKLCRAKSVVFAEFEALGAKENEELRNQLKAENSEYYVAKKTLLNLALKEKKYDNIDARSFSGKVAAVFGYEDEVAPAKILDKFKQSQEDKIEFVGGILDNKYISKDEVAALAKIPSKIELYAKLVGSFSSPISGFVRVLQGNIRNLVYALKAIADKKQA